MNTTTDNDIKYTYTYTYLSLRVAMISLLVMLLFSVGYQLFFETNGTCLLGSISAYYYTPARPIFVGALCALCVCLVTYRGHSKEEDLLLNFSGIMAAVVAVVPTVPNNICGPNAYSQTLPEIAAAVRNNIWSLVILTFLGAMFGRYLRQRIRRQQNVSPQEKSRTTTVITVVCAGVIGVEGFLFLISRARFIEVSHYVAAINLVAGVTTVMLFSAFRNSERGGQLRTDSEGARPPGAWSREKYKRIYIVIASTLISALALTLVIGKLLSDSDHFVLVAEVIVIVHFCVYWGIQTRELLDLGSPTLTTMAPEPARSMHRSRLAA